MKKVFNPGIYHSKLSDLEVEIVKVSYYGSDYMKAKVNVYNKYYGYIYETRTNYKLYYKNIQHWEKQHAIG